MERLTKHYQDWEIEMANEKFFSIESGQGRVIECRKNTLEDFHWHFYKLVVPQPTLDEVNKMSMNEIFSYKQYALLFQDEDCDRIIELSKKNRADIKSWCQGYYDKENAKRIYGEYFGNEKLLEVLNNGR